MPFPGRRLGQQREPPTEADEPPAWGYFPSEQYLIRHWDHTAASVTPAQQRLRLVRAFVQEDTPSRELFSAMGRNGVISRQPNGEEVRMILEPWRPNRLRKVARMLLDLQNRYQYEPMFARTWYAVGSADEQKMRGFLADSSLTSEPPVNEEDYWWRVLNDESLFDVGEDWAQIYDILPEVIKVKTDRSLKPDMGHIISELDKTRSHGQSRLERVADAVQYEAFSGTSVVLFDKTFFESVQAQLVLLDNKGHQIRCSRIVADDIARLNMAHFQMNLETQPCSDSIAEFLQTVTDDCGHTLYAFQEGSERKSSAQALAEGFSWAQNIMCIQEGDEYCLGDLHNGTVEVCSGLILHYGAVLRESPYGRSRFSEAIFKKMLQNCDADPEDYPYTYTPGPPAPTTTTDPPEPSPEPSCRGETYTAKEDDDCDSIALANSVKNETCGDFVQDKGFSIVPLMSWNPELKTKCNTNITPNLDQLEGRHICIEQCPIPDNFRVHLHEPCSAVNVSMPKLKFHETNDSEGRHPSSPGPGSPAPLTTSPTRGPITLTSEFDPTFTPPPETMTRVPDLGDKEREWTQCCWIIDEDWQEDFHPDDLPGACQSFFSRWCEYDTGLPSPTSIDRFPAVCTPDRSNYGPPP
ncbi:uncharacterized protein J7T54_001967 [Emericellopsis cladophorae]|uniref:Uncharacterized protein n=1 Tax=Emericellopsis cladophorae TaxID=2686198 RepID=A0A9P9XYW7_9HYPO|nr:uncharacterized protein J7T54_001967 [Emericellopsis cladophorae]KAI6779879.1 hypothetical protein J7T54_001967 [Emericellopsis cladophorae]